MKFTSFLGCGYLSTLNVVSSQSVDTGGFRCQSPRRDGPWTQKLTETRSSDLPCITKVLLCIHKGARNVDPGA